MLLGRFGNYRDHPEEESLERNFGNRYLEYKAKVRRWL
ncbi:hypothetical protein D1AOALGA4SA_11516 [Olavius algarvensis Delta 1 endosymbiont]|nr:hypothetical protein D1AOALGA4SA_11516 [Olavius algarvensis Delta 1 endosymbiont]